MNDYLPEWATFDEAAAWLQERTGEAWPLPRLVEKGLTPHVWVTPDREAASNETLMRRLFCGRHEGFLAEMIFGSDARRLAVERGAVLSLTRTPSGEIVRFTPPVEVELSELRFEASAVRGLVPPDVSAPPAAPTRAEKWTPEALAKLKAYRVAHGTKKTAEHFRISEARVRKLLPSDNPPPKGFSVFNRRPK